MKLKEFIKELQMMEADFGDKEVKVIGKGGGKCNASVCHYTEFPDCILIYNPYYS